MSYSEAYRQAYDARNMNSRTIAAKSSILAKQDNIRAVIVQRQQELARSAVWDREQALEMLGDIAAQAKEHVISDDGAYNSAAAGIAIKAIEQANKMCGYNEPEKVQMNSEITVTLEGEVRQWAR